MSRPDRRFTRPWRPRRSLGGWAAALVAVTASGSGAQEVDGVLTDQTTGRPLSAALVRLETPGGQTAATVLTDERGRFRVRGPGPGRFRLVTRHIGHQDVRTDPFRLETSQVLRLTLEAPMSPIRIAGVTARQDRHCHTLSDDDATTVAAFWDEARKALEATRFTAEEGDLAYRVEHFDRRLDPDDLSVIRDTTWTRQGSGALPFRSLPAEELARDGFVTGSDQEGRDYFAPDAPVLLSDVFVNSHCFRLAAPDDGSGRIAVEFEPVEDRDVPDVRGSVWLDGTTLALERLEFGYTGLDLGVDTDRLGGWVRFTELKSGAWIVERWGIRMPTIRVYTMRSRRLHRTLDAIREVGGVVLSVTDPSGTPLLPRSSPPRRP